MISRMFKVGLTAIAVVVALVLTACSTKPDISDAVPVQSVAVREAQLELFTPWRALGSIAVDSEKQGKVNASFAWKASRQGFDIKLFGPLGIQVVHLSQDKNGAQITDRSGSFDGDNAAELLAAALGASVPINEMQLWAVGLPGDANEVSRDEVGRLDNMTVTDSNGIDWKVGYERYTVFEAMYLPRSVQVESDGVLISLSIKKWSREEVLDGDRLTIPDGRLSIPGVGT